MNVLEKIKALRRDRGISQKEMAEKLNISKSTYQKIEQNLISLTVDRFLEICRLLNIESYNDILPEVNTKTIEEVGMIIHNGIFTGEEIRKNSNYVVKLIDELIEKINDEKIDLNSVSEEIEFLINYHNIIRRESQNLSTRLESILDKIEKIN